MPNSILDCDLGLVLLALLLSHCQGQTLNQGRGYDSEYSISVTMHLKKYFFSLIYVETFYPIFIKLDTR